jgi:predicted metal-binding membrane protein
VTNSGSRVALSIAGVFTIAAWAFTIHSAGTMAGAMPMPGGWSMSMAWMPMGDQPAGERAAMFLVMWTVMMVAMMLPSVMPVVMLHRRLLDARAEGGETGTGSNLWLLVGYFAVWAGFGGVAYIIGLSISTAVMRSATLSRAVPAATGLTLVAAGAYQLTRWKRVCLSHCRSPLEFFSHHRIRSAADSLMFGLHHGAYCAACCWALMVIQLALGMMSLPLMVAVAAVIVLEKQWRHGEAVAVAVGIAAVVSGAVMVLEFLR